MEETWESRISTPEGLRQDTDTPKEPGNRHKEENLKGSVCGSVTGKEICAGKEPGREKTASVNVEVKSVHPKRKHDAEWTVSLEYEPNASSLNSCWAGHLVSSLL